MFEKFHSISILIFSIFSCNNFERYYNQLLSPRLFFTSNSTIIFTLNRPPFAVEFLAATFLLLALEELVLHRLRSEERARSLKFFQGASKHAFRWWISLWRNEVKARRRLNEWWLCRESGETNLPPLCSVG